MKNSEIQYKALKLAVALHGADPVSDPQVTDDILMIASDFARWLGNPVLSIKIVPDVLTYQQQGTTVHSTYYIGGKVQLADNQQVALSLEFKDAKGFETNEAGDVVITWTSSDESVVVLQPAADGLTCLAVAGVPGAALATVSDGTNSGSLAFDVTAGGAVSIEVVAGTPEDQPPAG